MDKSFFEGFSRDLHDAKRWESFYRREQTKNPALLPKEVPPVPDVDAEWLFNDMMRQSTAPDPWMYPALLNLKGSDHYILAACSNTVIFPPGHPLATEDHLDHPVKRLFDVFVSSAHVGLRKPDPKMYHLALEKVDEFARQNSQTTKGNVLGWEEGVKAEDVVFLDDIGENLKAAKREGFRTIKVNLGRTYEAVDELEAITGLKLAGKHPRIPVKPKNGSATTAKARM